MSKIAWTDKAWNPVTGCTKVSAGCQFCYAEKMAKRLRGRHGYPADDPFKVTLRPERLDEPLKWRRPCRCFVCSMSDLFHKDVPDEFIDRVFSAMALSARTTFQVLTKRPERMAQHTDALGQSFKRLDDAARTLGHTLEFDGISLVPWPLENVWLGTSVEDQKTFDERVPHLLKCPAAVRFLSVEPLLGSIKANNLDDIDWVIIGCESKGKYVGRLDDRPIFEAHQMDVRAVDWQRKARYLTERCIEQNVPVFVKQIPGLDGKVIKKMADFPKSLQFQEYPK